jgi:selenide,water dikinase
VLTKALGTGFVTTAHKAGELDKGDALFDAAVAGMIQLNDIGLRAMQEVGVHAATDITGFGLAGHGFEMASGSGVTLVIDLARLPLLPGVQKFARKPFLTRASVTNRAYVEKDLRIEGKPDPAVLEVFFDAQTSGGLLISVPEDRAEALVENVRKYGASNAQIIGDVTVRGETALVVRA